jgi:Ca2+-binding EF-hand superfamily protein
MEVITGNDTKVDGYNRYSGYYCWNDGERQELHDIFTLLDTENRGVISLAELVAILSLLVNSKDENDENDTPTYATTLSTRSSSSSSSTSSTLMTKRLLQRIRLQYGHGLRRLKSNADIDTKDAPMLMVERNNTGKDAPMNDDDDATNDDATNDIFLNRDEFLCLATTPIQESHDVTDDDDDETVFGLFDVDEKGYISVHDLQRVATELNWYSPTDENSTTAPPGGAGTGATTLDAAAAAAAARADEPTRLSSLLVTHDDVTEMVYRLSSSGRITLEQFRTELLGRRSSCIP